MKNLKKSLLAAVLIMFAFVNINAADQESSRAQKATGNLITGIKSENDGLKRSAIYFAGKYKVTETSNALVEQFDKEKDPRTKILIAHSLFRMNDDEAMKKIYILSSKDSNERVKRLTAAIYETYKLDKYNLEEFLATNN